MVNLYRKHTGAIIIQNEMKQTFILEILHLLIGLFFLNSHVIVDLCLVAPSPKHCCTHK